MSLGEASTYLQPYPHRAPYPSPMPLVPRQLVALHLAKPRSNAISTMYVGMLYKASIAWDISYEQYETFTFFGYVIRKHAMISCATGRRIVSHPLISTLPSTNGHPKLVSKFTYLGIYLPRKPMASTSRLKSAQTRHIRYYEHHTQGEK